MREAEGERERQERLTMARTCCMAFSGLDCTCTRRSGAGRVGTRTQIARAASTRGRCRDHSKLCMCMYVYIHAAEALASAPSSPRCATPLKSTPHPTRFSPPPPRETNDLAEARDGIDGGRRETAKGLPQKTPRKAHRAPLIAINAHAESAREVKRASTAVVAARNAEEYVRWQRDGVPAGRGQCARVRNYQTWANEGASP